MRDGEHLDGCGKNKGPEASYVETMLESKIWKPFGNFIRSIRAGPNSRPRRSLNRFGCSVLRLPFRGSGGTIRA